MSRDAERARAKALKAPDARELLHQQLPFLAKYLAPENIDKVQRVLDAAVVNPAVQKEVDELNRKSIRSQSGNLVHRDPDIVARANKASEKFIPISKMHGPDWRVHLNPLFAQDALSPTTDNPDEAAYLLSIKSTLVARGAWLRFSMSMRQDLPNPTALEYDPRTFKAWLSVGPDGDTIPTKTGELTRKELLGTTILGAGYWQHVHQGPTQTMLKNAIERVSSMITDGRDEHHDWDMHRLRSNVVVVKVSDVVGGADWPDIDIWDPPHKILVEAMNQNVGGNVTRSAALVVVAAMLAEQAAKRLSDAIDDTMTGAKRAVKVLKILKTAGQIAECVLVVRAVGMGIIRLARGKAAQTGAEVGVKRVPSTTEPRPVNHSPGAYANTGYPAPGAYANTVNQANATLDTTGAGLRMAFYDAEAKRRIAGWTKDVQTMMAQAQKARGGRSIQIDEIEIITTLADKKWGDIRLLLH